MRVVAGFAASHGLARRNRDYVTGREGFHNARSLGKPSLLRRLHSAECQRVKLLSFMLLGLFGAEAQEQSIHELFGDRKSVV